jgi:hypothetical protein
MAARVPDPAYPAKDSAVLYGDKELYARIGKVAEGKGGKRLVESFEIPIRSGKAWVVKKGWLVYLPVFFWGTRHGNRGIKEDYCVISRLTCYRMSLFSFEIILAFSALFSP